QSKIELVDQWLNLAAGLTFESPTSIWTFPVQSVSQSESGFELVHQSVVVQPHWVVRADQNGRWVTKMRLTTSTGTNLGNSSDRPMAAAVDS
ncbi:MAG: alpha-amylase/4-alpha-glucanotransferase domain-containing protein, partial [Planctomycetota bacterium]